MGDTSIDQSFNSKLEEQTLAKGDLSYSSWAAKTSSTAPTGPKKLTAEELAEEEARKQALAGASAWNHAGTFEERNVTSFAKETLNEILVGSSSSDSVTIESVDSVSGEAHLWLVRGQRRAGFDLEIKVTWTLKDSSKGIAKLGDITGDDLDDEMEFDIEFTSCEDSNQAAARSAVQKGLQSIFAEKLNELLAGSTITSSQT